jgi:hypothetical protein
MNGKRAPIFWRNVCFVSFILATLAGWEILQFVLSRPIALFASKWTVLLFGLLLLSLLALTIFLLTFDRKRWGTICKFLDGPEVMSKPLRVLAFCIFILLLPIYTIVSILLATPLADIQDPFFNIITRGWQLVMQLTTGWPDLGVRPGVITNLTLRLWLFWMLGLFAALIVRRGRKGLSHGGALALTMLLQAVVYEICAYAFQVSTFPFSLDGWSESSRYYYASLLFAKSLYGSSLQLSVWHPTRYFLQSLPFLIPDLSLAAHRAWQTFLFLGMTAVTAILLTRRLRITNGWTRWPVAAWAFLFLFQGGVYYNLLVCVILVLAGFSLFHPKRTWLIILLASFWAGMSRLNWFPVPGMLAGLLYFLEKPYGKNDKPWTYFLPPVLWGAIGTGTALLGQAVYIQISGNSDVRSFGSSLTSNLLWYRLLPNPTYAPGILLALTLAALPVILIIAWMARKKNWLSGWPLTGLAAYLAVLLLGGLVVSVKIGGGGELHNMDAFMVTLMIGGAYALVGRTGSRSELGAVEGFGDVPWRWLAFAVLAPILFAAVPYITIPSYDHAKMEHELSIVRAAAETAAQDGEVLFISQRHLVTFGSVPVALTPDYELLTLMEMAISGNTPYLDRFHADLREQRFSLIVAPEQKLIHKGAAYSFGEENDAWVGNVSRAILCYYEPLQIFKDLDVQLLVPRQIITPDCNP